MTDEQIALAKRAVACKGWRWMPGMEFHLDNAGAMSSGWRVQSVQMRVLDGWAHAVRTVIAGPCEFILAPRGNIHVRFTDGTLSRKPSGTTMLPCIEDHATLGCLLALVREATNDPNACVCWSFSDDLWMCEAKHEYEGKTYLGLFAQASTYAGSLVAALEAAP
jgi:hypothetical protein